MLTGFRMTRLLFISAGALFLAVALLIGACSTPAGNPEDGKRWYSMHHCFACHGARGDDGKAPNVKGLEMSFWRFERILRDAGSPIMPKYPKDKISKQEVADLHAFLKAQ